MTLLVRGIYAIALARYLGPEQYGLFNYALGWYLAFMPFSSLGLWAVMSRDVGQSETRGHETVAQSLALRSLLSLATASACGLSGWLLHSDETTRQLLLVFSMALLGRSLANWLEHVFNAYSSSRFVFRLESIFRPAEAVSGVAMLALGGGMLGLALVHGLIWWAQGLVGLSLMRRNLFHVQPAWQRAGILRLLRKGALMGLASFLIVWFMQGPLLMARHTGFSLVELGQLALLLQIFTILSQVPQMFIAAALPILSRPEQQQKGHDREIVETSLLVVWLLGSLGALLGWAFGPWLVRVLFGASFSTAGDYLGIVILLLVPFSWGNLLWLNMLSRGLLRKPTQVMFIAGVTFTLAFPWIHFSDIPLARPFSALSIGLLLWVALLYRMQGMPTRLLATCLLVDLIVAILISISPVSIAGLTSAVALVIAGFWFQLKLDQRKRILSLIYRQHVPGR